MLDLAIVGGGPGGLMSAWYLKRKLGELCRVTIFEASDRVGGKILTRKFDSAPATYEAGVAEIYDYSMTGPDPLRELIQHFGLQTIPMDAEQIQLDGELLNDVAGMRRKYGPKTADAIEAFRERCAEMVSPIEYYEGVGAHDNEHPWAYISCEELLDREVDDPTAKRFFKVMARSDLATECHNTNGLNALKNFVMDVDGYIGLYSIQNGNEQLIECLQSEVDADIQLNHRVLKVGKTAAGRYQLNMMNGKGPETRDFDLVLMCLPHSWLGTMRWDGEQLRRSMVKHIAYFDRPAHYLRISILFDEPFWGEKIPGAWFMSEAFGGCCVYNEGARHDVGKHGVLNWLIAGSDALAFANLGDQELIDAALKSLPPSLGDARAQLRARGPDVVGDLGRVRDRGVEQVARDEEKVAVALPDRPDRPEHALPERVPDGNVARPGADVSVGEVGESERPPGHGGLYPVGFGPSRARLTTAARRPAPTPMASRVIARFSSENGEVPVAGAGDGGGSVWSTGGGGGAGVFMTEAREIMFCWMAKSSVASSIVI